MMNRLRGVNGYNISIDDQEDQLVLKRPNGRPLIDHEVHFFYGCGKPERELKEEAGDSRVVPSYQFFKFFGQEQMEAFGVRFS